MSDDKMGEHLRTPRMEAEEIEKLTGPWRDAIDLVLKQISELEAQGCAVSKIVMSREGRKITYVVEWTEP